MVKPSPPNRGRPRVPKEQRNDRSGFTPSQRRQLRQEARRRNIPMAMVVREMADYYFTALDQSRGDIFTHQEATVPVDKP